MMNSLEDIFFKFICRLFVRNDNNIYSLGIYMINYIGLIESLLVII